MKKYILILLLFLVSCTNIKDGTIIQKVFEPAHCETHMRIQHIGEMIMSTPETTCYKDKFWIQITKKIDSKFYYNWIIISENNYNIHKIGDYISLDKNKI